MRRPRPLTLGLPLHDCGAAADLPRGRPRKPAGVSSAAPARRTSKPRLSVPSRAGATSVRTRPARGTQGRCGERAASVGGAWGTRSGAGRGGASAGLCRLETTPAGLGSSGHPGAEPCLPATSRRAVSLTWGGATWSEAGQGAGPPSFPSLSLLHARLGRPHAPPPQLVGQVTTTVDHSKSAGFL